MSTLAQLLATLFVTAWLAVAVDPALAQTGGRRIALVVGNDAYRHAPPLRNAREDARSIAEALRKTGYQVRLEVDLDQRGLLAALRAFRQSINGGDEVVVFFAGHGVQIGAANFLLPIDIHGDSEEQLRDEALLLQRVLDDVAERRPRFSLTIVDACRNNPFKASGRAMGTTRGLAATTAATGQIVIYSAGAGQLALDRLSERDTARNGLFTRVFVEEMMTPDVPIDRIVRRVRQRVSDLAAGVGHEQVPAIYDQVSGDFYFVGRGPTLTAPQAPAAATDPNAIELSFWNSMADSRDPAELQAYLNRFPNGHFADLARARLRSATVAPTTATTMVPKPVPASAVTRPAMVAEPAPARPAAPTVVTELAPQQDHTTADAPARTPAQSGEWGISYRDFDASTRRLIRTLNGRLTVDRGGLRIDGGYTIDAQGRWLGGDWLPLALADISLPLRIASGQSVRLISTRVPGTMSARVNSVEAVAADAWVTRGLLRVKFTGHADFVGYMATSVGHHGEFVVDPATGLVVQARSDCHSLPQTCAFSPFFVTFELVPSR